MAKAKNSSDVETLLAERVRFETWLDQLAAKAPSMPDHVVERVRGDYEARLRKVVESLHERANDLREQVATLADRLSGLQTDLTARADARAEDELRAMVGEYDETEWARRCAEHDSGIASLDGERAECETEHARMVRLLEDATRPLAGDTAPEEPIAAPVEVAAEPAQEPPVEAAAPPSPEPLRIEAPPLPDPPRQSSPSLKRPSPFDELGFLRTVVGRATPFPPPEVVPGAANEGQTNDVAERRDSIRRSLTELEAPMADSGAARTSTPGMPAMTDTPAAAAPSPSIDRVSGSTEAARSLKCQECGWMNYPTEWYCEKCGGELAAF